jgi:hypothetical protein
MFTIKARQVPSARYLCTAQRLCRHPFTMARWSTVQQARWRRVALAFSLLALMTFLFNLCFTLFLMIGRRQTIQDGIGVFAELSCKRSKTVNTLLHILINIISTVLLAGSNYCMQCVMAPTRAQVDDAHQNRRWLDIGVPSIRNLWHTRWRNRALWGLLSVSSIPLHLL